MNLYSCIIHILIICYLPEPSATTDTKLLRLDSQPQPVNSRIATNDLNQSSVAEILDFVDENVKKFRFARTKELVLILGDTDSDKILLNLLITDAELDVQEEAGKYIFVDKFDLLNQYSCPIIPELMTDKKSAFDYYILPSWNSTIDVKHEILITHLIHRVIKFSEAAKFIFTIEYDVMKDESQSSDDQKREVMNLVINAVRLLKDVEQLKNSFALVVMNAKNKLGEEYELVVERVVQIFRLVLKIFPPGSPEKLFINILLADDLKRVAIFGGANQTGSVNDIPWMQEHRKYASMVIHNTVQYYGTNSHDFGYLFSNETSKRFPELIQGVQDRLIVGMSKIGSEIELDFELQESRLQDLSMLHEKMNLAYQHMSQINGENPVLFGKQLIDAVQTLGIDVSIDNSDTILDHLELIDLMKTASNSSAVVPLADMVKDIKQYFNESMMWYKFALKLHDSLSEYDVQRNTSVYQSALAALTNELTIRDYEKLNVNETSLKQFIKSVGKNIDPEIENIKVNSFKLKTLKSVLKNVMSTSLDSSCSSDRLVVKGYNVKISDVTNVDCIRKAKYIEIMVLNKLFFDDNINKPGENAQLSIISPTWEIIGKRNIILNGKDREPHDKENAADGTTTHFDGVHGKPGKPGFSSGSILVIGKTFSNAPNLKIQLHGGRGGLGQNGGKGFCGFEGIKLIDCTSSEDCLAKLLGNSNIQITYRSRDYFGFWPYMTKKYTFHVVGNKGTVGGKGGDGGVGGYGGDKGEFLILGIKETPNFVISSKPGYNGTKGNGGSGGINPKPGQSWKTYIKDEFILIIWNYNKPKHSDIKNNSIPQGENGIAGNNKIGIESPKNRRISNPSFIVNNYKNYLRDHLPNSIRELDLRNFFDDIEKDTGIQSLYNTKGLINELQGMENQYFGLRKQLDFLPFVQSLLNRTAAYGKQFNRRNENKIALDILYTAICSKLINIKTNENGVTVVNLLGYLNLVKNNINSLKADKAANMDEYRNEYDDSLKEKIEGALDLVKNEILPEIETIFDNINENIIELIDEIVHMTEVEMQNLGEAFDKKHKAQNALIFHLIMNGLKVVGAVLSFWNEEAGAVVGTIGDIGNTIYDNEVLRGSKSHQNNKYREFIASLNSSMFTVKEAFKKEHKLFLVQLNDINNELKDAASIWADNIRKKVKDLIAEVKKKLESNDLLNPKEIGKLRKDLKEIITTNKPDESSNKGKWFTVDKIVNLANVALELYNTFRNDQRKIAEIAEAIEKIKEKIKIWNELLDDVYTVVVPMIAQMQTVLANIGENLEGATHVELDITQWRIQSSLQDIKVTFKKMSKGTNVEANLERSIDKLDEAMAVLINVYDRIDSYNDKAKFADYFANMLAGGKPNFQDPELNTAILRLKQIIQTNLVLEQYEVAMQAFKQHQFPFAQLHLSVFEFAADVPFNNTDVFIQRAYDQINYLRNQVQLTQVSVGKFDREIFGNIDFQSSEDNNQSIAMPFYQWNYMENSNDIDRYIRGEEIVLKADIRKGLNFNAVKFNEIDLVAKLPTEQLQADFDSVLRDYHAVITMSVVGNSYYRCGAKIYYISIDDNLVFEYSTSRGSDGRRKKANELYRKISESGYFVSPYTLWKIQLKEDSFSFLNSSKYDDLRKFNNASMFDELKRFQNVNIKMELRGRGQYFKNELYAAEVCNEELDKFYHRDNTTSTSTALETSKFKYFKKP